MQSAADQLAHSVTVWTPWWRVTTRFLRLMSHRKAWGVIGKHLEKIIDRTDLRTLLLRRSWSQQGSVLRAIKARGRELCLDSSLRRLYPRQIRTSVILRKAGDIDIRVQLIFHLRSTWHYQDWWITWRPLMIPRTRRKKKM